MLGLLLHSDRGLGSSIISCLFNGRFVPFLHQGSLIDRHEGIERIEILCWRWRDRDRGSLERSCSHISVSFEEGVENNSLVSILI
jgi:hypothetical protein